MNKNSRLLMLLALEMSITAQGQVDLTLADPNLPVYPDTLTLSTDNKVELTFAFYQMRDKELYFKNELWKGMLNTMASAIESSKYYEGIQVSYSNVNEGGQEVARIEVEPFEKASDIYIIGQDGITERLSDRIDFRITLEKVAVSFSLTDLDQLEEIKEINVESVWDQINRKYENYGLRDVYTASGLIKYGNANIGSITSDRLTLDGLEISAGIGLGFIRDQFVPDFGIMVGVNIPDRLGRKKSEVGLLYTQHVFYQEQEDRAYEWDSNGFLSGFYRRIFSRGYEIGFSLGTLILENGDHFQGDTYKFSLFTSQKGSGFSLAPEVIVTDNFNQAIPDMRIGFSF